MTKTQSLGTPPLPLPPSPQKYNVKCDWQHVEASPQQGFNAFDIKLPSRGRSYTMKFCSAALMYNQFLRTDIKEMYRGHLREFIN